LLATILGERAPGMTPERLPLTVWSWFVSALLILLAFGVLFAALVLLFCDRHLGTSFFLPMGDLVNGQLIRRGNGSPLLWLHLFWFFGHPEVYIAILPGMGLISGLLANFTRRPVVGYRMLAAATVLIGLLGFVVWGHHMFVSGMNPYAGTAFALTTMAIAVPSTAEVFSWLANIWEGGRGGSLELRTPMLFALGFVSFFIAGGVTGPILALPALDAYLHNTFFVVAHFHLIMAMAGVFSIFAGVYYWFPLVTGRLLHEGLGKVHFWLSFVAAYGTFFPMHLEGLAGRPRHFAEVTGSTSALSGLLPAERGITYAALLLGAAQLLFLANLLWSRSRGRLAGDNPWRATTLEWDPLPPGTTVTHGPYDYGVGTDGRDFISQREAAHQQE
jgi:cytochrome c oxidase subunit 1